MSLTDIPNDFGSGGSGINPTGNEPTLKALLVEHKEAIEDLQDNPVGGGTADGVSLDEEDGIWSVIPSYIQGLVAPTLPKAGTNLTDADATINPASSRISVSTMPVATMSDDRVITLGVAGSPVENSIFQVIRRDLTANTLTVNDDADTELIVFGASPTSPEGATFYFDETSSHYKLLNFFYVAV